MTYKLIYKSKKIVSTNKALYYYVQSQNSVMRKDFKEKRVIDTIDVYDEVYNFALNNNLNEIKELVLIRYFKYCIELTIKTKNSEVISDKEKVIKLIESKFEEKKKIFVKDYSDNLELMQELKELEKKFKQEIER